MKLKLKIKKLKEILFYISIFMMQFALFAQNITYIKPKVNLLLNISNILMFVTLITKLFLQKAPIKTWIIIFLLLGLSLINCIITADTLLITLILSIILVSDLDFKDVLQKDIYFKALLFFFILIMYFTGNVYKINFTREGQIRNALGFVHPNYLGYFVLILYFEIICYKENLKNIKDIILFVIINMGILYITNLAHSRTSQICIVIFDVLFILEQIKTNKLKLNKKNKKNKFLFYIIFFIFLTFLSFYVTKSFKNGDNYAIQLNKLLSNRLLVQQRFIDNNSITIFGKELFFYATLDNTYIHLLLNFGLIIWGLYAFIYSKMLQKCDELNNNSLKICIIVIMIYGLMEWYMIRPVINIFLLYIGTFLFENKGVAQNEWD